METERRKTRSTTTTAKRTPLSNLTNTLTSNPNSIKPQIHKPYNHNSSLKSSNTTTKPSKSDSSIGSSNVFNNLPNPNFPPPLLSTPPRPLQPQPPTSSTNQHGSEPLVIYSRKQSTEKTKKSEGDDAAVPNTDPNLEKTTGKRKEGFSPLTYTPVEKAKDKGKGVVLPFTSISSVKTKAKEKAISTSYNNREENEERGAIPLARSCPPLQITRNNRRQFDEARDKLQPKMHTDPHPTKKRRPQSPLENDVETFALKDFVEQQKAYFKEVDEFELLEEEVSD